jgi:hypothetical protein
MSLDGAAEMGSADGEEIEIGGDRSDLGGIGAKIFSDLDQM